MKRKLLLLILGCIVLIFLKYPNVISEGAKKGLLLWFQAIIPSLLPFMIFSTMLMRMNITYTISRLVYPVLHRIFGITEAACYPALIGMMSGYPLGAKMTADIYEAGQISKREAQYLLSFCNNASPMFLLEYIGRGCLGLQKPNLILLVVYLSGWLNAWIYRILQNTTQSRYHKKKKYKIEAIDHRNVLNEKRDNVEEETTFVDCLDDSILGSAEIMVKIGGYVILFSILAEVIKALLPVSATIKMLLICFFEITTGGEWIAGCDIIQGVKAAILCGFCAFGGLSSVAQTASVIRKTDLSLKMYIIQKLIQGGIAVLLFFCL